MSGEEPIAKRQRRRPACPKCFRPIVGHEDFCTRCGMPVSIQATTGPYERVLAEGFAYREASDKPYRPIILIGMWMLWGPWMVISVAILVWLIWHLPEFASELFRDVRRPKDLFGALFLIILLGTVFCFMPYVTVALLFKTTRNYLRLRRDAGSEKAEAREIDG